MKSRLLFNLIGRALALARTDRAVGTNRWTFDVTLVGLAAKVSGTAAVSGMLADVNVGFDKICDNLQCGAMGPVRADHDRWALPTGAAFTF